jgi:hypothetical protein
VLLTIRMSTSAENLDINTIPHTISAAPTIRPVLSGRAGSPKQAEFVDSKGHQDVRRDCESGVHTRSHPVHEQQSCYDRECTDETTGNSGCASKFRGPGQGPVVVLDLLAAMALASLISVLTIPADAIDHDLARGLDNAPSGQGSTDRQPSGFEVLVTCRPLLIFAVCVLLFHLANAAMLPLVGQKLALQDKNLGTTLMSACIVAAQIVMVPMAMLVGLKADRWGP